MYKQIAAYAAGMLRNTIYIPARCEGGMVWGLKADGEPTLLSAAARKISILGALRFSNDDMEGNTRTYNTLDKKVRQVARERYGKQYYDLDHVEAIEVLMEIAKGES